MVFFVAYHLAICRPKGCVEIDFYSVPSRKLPGHTKPSSLSGPVLR